MEELERKEKFKKAIHLGNLIVFWIFLIFIFNEKCLIMPFLGDNFGLSFYISIIGLPLCLIDLFIMRKANQEVLKISFWLLILFLCLLVSSLGMALFYYPDFNGYFGTNPIEHILFHGLKYLYDIFAFIYCVYSLPLIFKCKHAKTIFDFYILGFLIIGFIQLIILVSKSSALLNIYDKFDFLKILQSKNILQRIMLNYKVPRISGYANEPGHNGILLLCLVFPYLFGELIAAHFKKKRFFVYKLLLFIGCFIFAVLSFSSALYIAMAIEGVFFMIYIFSSEQVNKNIKIISLSTILFIIFSLFVINPVRNAIFSSIIKIFDTKDHSSMYHYSTSYNDLLVFFKHPIFGVGDGNQGYFYFENIVGTIFGNSVESQNSLVGKNGLLDGGCFVFSSLSGFGIVGTIAIICFFVYFIRVFSYKPLNKDVKHFLYNTSLILLIFFLMFRSGIHRNYGAFVTIAFCRVIGGNESKYLFYPNKRASEFVVINI
ncbi:MAG: oligosaccharide repeat unit polymerase [Bacilli bacterium]|nr:oligosaccharide repeat unit polymerase [Bacilli bacterium]